MGAHQQRWMAYAFLGFAWSLGAISGCYREYAPMPRSDLPGAPGATDATQGRFTGSVAWIGDTQFMGGGGFSLSVGHDAHIEVGGSGGPPWLMGFAGFRKTFRHGPHAVSGPFADLEFGAGVGVGGVRDHGYEPDGPRSNLAWDETFAAGGYFGGGFAWRGAEVPFYPYVRGRYQLSGAVDIAVTGWILVNGGIEIAIVRDQGAVNISAIYMFMNNDATMIPAWGGFSLGLRLPFGGSSLN